LFGSPVLLGILLFRGAPESARASSIERHLEKACRAQNLREAAFRSVADVSSAPSYARTHRALLDHAAQGREIGSPDLRECQP